MLKPMLALTAAAVCIAGTAFAGPAKTGAAKTGAAKTGAVKKPAAKVTDVNYCPITGEEVKGKGAGSEVVGKYRVHFCCAGCQPAFDKMSKADKNKKIADVLKKQSGAKKKTTA